MHVKLDHSGYIPDFITMTTAKNHERKEISNIPANKAMFLSLTEAIMISNYSQIIAVKVFILHQG